MAYFIQGAAAALPYTNLSTVPLPLATAWFSLRQFLIV